MYIKTKRALAVGVSEIYNYVDIKNGINFFIGDNNIFEIHCYENNIMNTIIIKIMPYTNNNEKKDFIAISSFLSSIKININNIIYKGYN